MTRLKHSPGGYRRRLQIGAAEVVILVEGKTDRYFYSKVFGPVCRSAGVPYSLRIARELPKHAGGKKALLSYFKYLRRKNSLRSVLGGKETTVLFVLDKDIDDMCRTTVRSEHVVYTEYYDFENYLYIHGDLVDAAAAASGLDVAEVEHRIGSPSDWRRRAQREWQVWTQVCVFSVTRKLRRGGNYGVVPSPINNHPYSGVDSAKLAARLTMLETEQGKGIASFRRAWSRVKTKVHRLYREGRADTVFKGKWYSWFLAQELIEQANGRDAQLSGLESRLPHHLAQSINTEAEWTNYLRNHLRRLLSIGDSATADL